MAPIKYEYQPIVHAERTIAHVFVAPQDLNGLGIGYIEPVENAGLTIGGDIFIGNPESGSYLIPFELTIESGVEGLLLLGEEEYDLKKGRAFVVKTGYEIGQLACQSKEDALKVLATL